jgi:alkanesulfonate monooxygenase SsuD/methylene tetrahydromethanopterin reductase-like flavin-dependent oxidoreductase (luciferase family)
MEFGYFHIPDDLSGARDYGELIAELRDIAAICDESSFDAIWLAEHHFSIWGRELSSNPLLLAADIASRTKRIRIGLAAAIITFWHPLRLAEDLATLDHLTDGRLEIGLGRGNYGLEATNLNPAADPNNPQQNFNVFNETLQILKLALGQDKFSYKGEHYQFPAPGFSADMAHTVDDPAYTDPATGELAAITTLPRPKQRPHPPLWIVVNSALSIQHAAENDCGIIMWRQTNRMLAARLAGYKESHDATHDTNIALGRKTAILRDAFVADSLDEARGIAGEAIMGALNFSNWRGPSIYLEPGEELDPGVDAAQRKELTFEFVNERALLFGSLDDVVEKLLALHRETAIQQVVLRCAWPGLAHEHATRSIRRLRDEVIPRVRAEIERESSAGAAAA